MTIAEARTSCKAGIARARAAILGLPRDILLVAILLLATSAAFGLGMLAGRAGPSTGSGQGSSVSLSTIPMTATALPGVADTVATLPASIPAGGQVVASKNGTKYYAPWCSGAARISSANKVYFASASAAQAAGYTPAVSCKGM